MIGVTKWGLKYINGTQQSALIISPTNIGVIIWYLDVCYEIHDDCKGCIGAIMMLGEGLLPIF